MQYLKNTKVPIPPYLREKLPGYGSLRLALDYKGRPENSKTPLAVMSLYLVPSNGSPIANTAVVPRLHIHSKKLPSGTQEDAVGLAKSMVNDPRFIDEVLFQHLGIEDDKRRVIMREFYDRESKRPGLTE